MASFERDQIAEFWNRTRKAAGEDLQTGYLGDEWPQAMSQNRFAGEWRQLLGWLRRFDVRRGAVLDVGCGTGLWLEHFARVFDRAHGIDLSSQMVASAQARLARASITNATAECRSVADLSGEGPYDVVFVGGVLMYVNDADLEGVVAGLAKLVAPGGVLVFRESTHRKTTWYRDKPLSPGLFADPKAERPPYFAIYRPAETYAKLLARVGLEVLHTEANRPYKLSDLTEPLVRAMDKLTRGGGRDRERAERWARHFHRHRWFWLWPAYFLIKTFAPGIWSINNHWFIARPAPSAPPAPPAPRSS